MIIKTAIQVRELLSANIKAGRRKIGLTQEKLAELAGLSTQTISDIEGCRTWVSETTLLKLAEVLKVDIFQLLMPKEVLSQNSIDLLTKYTEEAAFILSQSLDKLVTRSLKNLRNHYIRDQSEGK